MICTFGLFMAWYFGLSVVLGFLFLMLTKRLNQGLFATLRFISCFWIIVVEEIYNVITKRG
ncbi:hypothetical protein [uncultured Helicobacter sp.]|uniref:hypothetical protein n=1 Tax=uncultured Helicobacter sp. TaxID=175537 RepID=UPI0026101011|nr:hypothetical protein [uncultured Helicobacter sp.]